MLYNVYDVSARVDSLTENDNAEMKTSSLVAPRKLNEETFWNLHDTAVSPSGKAWDFGSHIRRFESYHR